MNTKMYPRVFALTIGLLFANAEYVAAQALQQRAHMARAQHQVDDQHVGQAVREHRAQGGQAVGDAGQREAGHRGQGVAEVARDLAVGVQQDDGGHEESKARGAE